MAKIIDKEAVTTIGTYILDGMNERESCILAGISYPDLQALKEKSENVRDFIEKKHIQFKHNNLKAIQAKKSEKNSQWLLEKLRPEEFGTKLKSQEQPRANIISLIIKDIQNNDNNIVRYTREYRAEESNEERAGEPARIAKIS